MPQLGPDPYLHPGAVVRNSRLGSFVEIGEGTHILESVMDDYSYTARYADIAYSVLGKFVNVAAFTRLNPGEHPYHRASLHHFMYRSSYYWPGEPDEAEVFDWRRSRPVRVGHDTWIGHGAVIMKGVTIGNGDKGCRTLCGRRWHAREIHQMAASACSRGSLAGPCLVGLAPRPPP